MKYWCIDISVSSTEQDYFVEQKLKLLEDNHYDAIILFAQSEGHFEPIVKTYPKILEIAEKKNIKIYPIVGSDASSNYPPNEFKEDNIELINWSTNFFRETLFQYTKNDIFDVNLINDLDSLKYKYHFVYLNANMRNHRCLLIDQISKHDLLKYSAYSWHNFSGMSSTSNILLNRTTSPYNFRYYNGSTKILDIGFSESRDQSTLPTEYYESFFQLVSETCPRTKFITEKTVTPLLVGKPFLVAGAPGLHKLLKDLGFELYDELFDYSFDDIVDTAHRFNKICEIIKPITNLSLDQCRSLHSKIQDKIIHNRTRVVELAYDQNYIPQIVRGVIKQYDETNQVLNRRLIDVELQLRSIKRKIYELLDY